MRRGGHKVEAHGPDDFIWFPRLRRLKRLRLLLGYTWTVLRRVLGGRFEVIELWGGPGWMACWILSLIPWRRFVIVSRSNGLEPHYKHVLRLGRAIGTATEIAALGGTLEEIGYRRCDALTLVSHFDEVFAHARHYKGKNERERVIVIENPLEDDWLGQEINFVREPVIGFVGSWIERKGSGILPEVMRRVLDAMPNVRFLLIGIGEETSRRLRRDFPDPNLVEIIPFCPRSELRNHYRRMAVLIAPSIYESFGLTFAESMACGAALAATPVGFAAGLIDGREFRAINEGSPAGITALIGELLGDMPNRQRIAEAGFKRVQSLCWSDAARRIISLYERLLRDKFGADHFGRHTIQP